MTRLIIIPGIDDRSDYIEWAVRKWPAKYGLEVVIYRFGWSDPVETYEEKMARLLAVGGDAVLGISAGGSTAQNARRRWPKHLTCAINVCGRSRPGLGGKWPTPDHPLFEKSVNEVADNEPPTNVLTFRPRRDGVVPPETVPLDGADNRQMFMAGHVPSILWTLFCHDRDIAAFIHTHLKSK